MVTSWPYTVAVNLPQHFEHLAAALVSALVSVPVAAQINSEKMHRPKMQKIQKFSFFTKKNIS